MYTLFDGVQSKLAAVFQFGLMRVTARFASGLVVPSSVGRLPSRLKRALL